MNRVMGMEVFDESISSINEDLKKLKEEKKRKDIATKRDASMNIKKTELT